MKEQIFLEAIKKITKSPYIGDDCAYLKELNLVITQDNFVENIHFKKDWATPYQIGYKATAVNISDILASGAKPQYLMVGISIPNVEKFFIEELYRGIKDASYGAEIIGGDITGGEQIFISITAIGNTLGRNISTRSGAKTGYIVVTSGEHGLSSAGLKELMNNGNNQNIIKAHLEPNLDIEFSQTIAKNVNCEYAMMDSSDGLADALFKIAEASKCTIKTPQIKGMFGAEDYKLVAAIPEKYLNILPYYNIVGEVYEYQGYPLKIEDNIFNNYDDLNLYNHFE